MLFVGSDERGVQSKRKDNGNARQGLNTRWEKGKTIGNAMKEMRSKAWFETQWERWRERKGLKVNEGQWECKRGVQRKKGKTMKECKERF